MSGAWLERRVCRVDDIENPGAREFQSGEGDWPFSGIVCRIGESVVAYANVCPHKGHPLNLIDDHFLISMPGGGRLLRCASHGALFVPETGLCVVGPCSGRSLTPLACRIDDGAVLVRAPASRTAL
ncbi:MAG: Rieske 2Fe-2S domain-containing protein [Gammaproteobacteria bacterium]|nr:Rieske 2Fe-2S domain-containing protein [Gammaproteobacteria bacterium]